MPIVDAWWFELSGAELTARLVQRGMTYADARWLADTRDRRLSRITIEKLLRVKR